MLQVNNGFLHRSNSIEFRIRAVTKTFQLRKDKPNPVTVFSAPFELCDDAVNDGLLRIYEALQIVIVSHNRGQTSLSSSSRLASTLRIHGPERIALVGKLVMT